jgi:hypothetical protein
MTKKQVANSRSSAEVELRAMTLMTTEVTWLWWLLEHFGVSISMLTPLLSDSTGAISIARDPVKHELTKHIGVDAHFTRSQVQDGVVALQSSSWQISSERLRLTLIVSFISPNSMLLIHHEFGGIRYVLAFFYYCIFLEDSLYILSLLYMYIFGHLTLR